MKNKTKLFSVTAKDCMGNLKYEYRISLAITMIDGINLEKDDPIQKEIDFLLSILPEGTMFCGAKKRGIEGSALVWDLNFEHPLFEDGTKIETEYVRVCWVDTTLPEGRQLRQKNLFIGIRYYNPDGTERWPWKAFK